MSLVYREGEDLGKIQTGDLVIYDDEMYFVRSRGRRNVEIRDDNPNYKKGVKVSTVKRELCRKIEIGVESDDGNYKRIIGDLRSEMLIGRVITEKGNKEKRVKMNKLSVY